MKLLTNDELLQRAKALYFNKHKELDEIFADQYGRFSYQPNNLVELNRTTGAKVMKITREGVEKVAVKGVNDFSDAGTVKKHFKEKPAKGDKKGEAKDDTPDDNPDKGAEADKK